MNRLFIPSLINKKKSITLLLLISLALISCTENEFVINKNKELNTEFHAQILKAKIPQKITKSGQIASESFVNEIQVLVFEEDLFIYRVSATHIVNGNNNDITFKARIRSSNKAIKLYIFANVEQHISANEPVVGENITNVQNKLNFAINSATILNNNIPMWASQDLPVYDATATNTISGIKMLRSVARVDVINANSIPFTFATIQAFNVADKIQIIPDSVTSLPSVSSPTIPSGTTYNVVTTSLPTSNSLSSIAQIYLPESEGLSKESSSTCIILGGYYNGSSELSYYRLDFNPGIDRHPLGQILRNYRYEFNLIRISENGFSTPEEAANSSPSGIEADVVVFQDQIHNIIFNESTYFGISKNLITLSGSANSILTLATETNASDYSISWANAQGAPTGTPSNTSIENEYFKVEKAVDQTTLDITTIQQNPIGSGIRNIRYVLVQAGTLKMLLTLIQEPDHFTPGDVIWADTNVDEPGTFAPSIADPGKFYQWNRRKAWAITGSITGWNSTGSDGNSWEDTTDPCPEGWRVPSNKELGALLNDSPGRKWRSIYTGYIISGVWFAPTQAEAEAATIENPGSAIFLPAPGKRNFDTGNINSAESNGYYWADNLDTAGKPYALSIVDGTSGVWAADNRASGHTVRCVRANN